MRKSRVNDRVDHQCITSDQQKEKKSLKYHNRKTMYQGVQFDSRKEADRYQELLLLERAGHICNLELQPRYDLVVNDYKLGFYRADFRYEEVATGQSITEDVKSPATKTAVYRLKKKLVNALHGVEIIEV